MGKDGDYVVFGSKEAPGMLIAQHLRTSVRSNEIFASEVAYFEGMRHESIRIGNEEENLRIKNNASDNARRSR